MNKEEVLNFCKKRHENQRRKGGEPYINHLIETAKVSIEILNELSNKYSFLIDEISDIYAAALLHDTIEDTNTDYEDILELANEKVASWVASLSNDKRLPSEMRRFLYYKKIGNSCIEIKIIKQADIFSNLNGLNGKEEDKWIYQFIKKAKMSSESLKPELFNTKYYIECQKLIHQWGRKLRKLGTATY